MEQILIKKHVEDLILPKKIKKGDWIDLRAAESVVIQHGESKLISLGISMKLPDGYGAQLAPRSSTFKKFGLMMTNGVGVIENSYCGNDDIWMFPAICLNQTHLGCSIIEKNDRICQFRIVEKQPNIEFVETDSLDGENRGGFGSTGIK